MNQKYFEPYHQTICNCIDSSATPEHLTCCWDMIARFIAVFAHTIAVQELNERTRQMYEKYYEKSTQLFLR